MGFQNLGPAPPGPPKNSNKIVNTVIKLSENLGPLCIFGSILGSECNIWTIEKMIKWPFLQAEALLGSSAMIF